MAYPPTDDFILKYRTIRSDPEAPKMNVENVKKFLTGRGYQHQGIKNLGPVADAECEFLQQEGDLIALVPKDKPPLKRWLDRHYWFVLSPFFRKKKVSIPADMLKSVLITTRAA